MCKRSDWLRNYNVRSVNVQPATDTRPAALVWRGGSQTGKISLGKDCTIRLEKAGKSDETLVLSNPVRSAHFRVAPAGEPLSSWLSVLTSSRSDRLPSLPAPSRGPRHRPEQTGDNLTPGLRAAIDMGWVGVESYDSFIDDAIHLEGVAELPYETLHRASGGFASANVIGAGGFGKVYRADVPGIPVATAIKRLHKARELSDDGIAQAWPLASRSVA